MAFAIINDIAFVGFRLIKRVPTSPGAIPMRAQQPPDSRALDTDEDGP